jgi:hypothetical protein
VISGISGVGTLLLAAVGLSELAQHAATAAELFLASVITAGTGAIFTLGFGALLAREWRKRVRRARLRLEHLLDELTGEAPVPDEPSVLELLRR